MDESYECIYYVKEQKTIEQWTCLLCNIIEIKLKLGKHKVINKDMDKGMDKFMEWDQYKLQCGHMVHPRCYRVWSYKQDAVGCSICGLLPLTDENIHCYQCNTWGHKSNDCPILQFTYHHIFLTQQQMYEKRKEEKQEL